MARDAEITALAILAVPGMRPTLQVVCAVEDWDFAMRRTARAVTSLI